MSIPYKRHEGKSHVMHSRCLVKKRIEDSIFTRKVPSLTAISALLIEIQMGHLPDLEEDANQEYSECKHDLNDHQIEHDTHRVCSLVLLIANVYE